MTTELVYRMRTCAAAMMANSGNANTPFQRMYCDAAELLAEASNLLDVPEPLGEPMDNLAEANAAIWGAEPKSTWVASGDACHRLLHNPAHPAVTSPPGRCALPTGSCFSLARCAPMSGSTSHEEKNPRRQASQEIAGGHL